MIQHSQIVELAQQQLATTQNLISDYLDILKSKSIPGKTNQNQWPKVHVDLLLKGVREVEHLLCEMQDVYDAIENIDQ